MKNFALATLTALGLSAGALHAAPLTIDYQTPGDAFGDQGWYSAVTITSTITNGTYNGGQFNMTLNGLEDIFAFCVEVSQGLVAGDSAYENTPNLFDAGIRDNIDRLFSSAYGSVVDGLSAAGFQVALWEIVEDTNTGIDLSSGNFAGADPWWSDPSTSVIDTAQVFLDGLSSASTGVYNLDFLASPSSQDLVTATLAPTTQFSPTIAPVPLPASGLLLLSAAGLMMVRRKKS